MTIRSRNAFTLIELAAAFAVFSLILLAVGAVVQQSSESWRNGLDAVSASDEGRAFTDEVFRDLTSAICTSNFPFVVINQGSGSSADDGVFMVAGHRRYNTGSSDLCEIAYFLRKDPDPAKPGRMQLCKYLRNTIDREPPFDDFRTSPRYNFSNAAGANRNTTSGIVNLVGQMRDAGTPLSKYISVLASNVRSFRAVCYDANNNMVPLPSGKNYSSIDPNRSDANFVACTFPARVEMTLEILPDETWLRKNAPGGAPAGLEDSTVETFSIAVSPTQTAY